MGILAAASTGGVVDSLKTAFTTIASDVTSGITGILPIALGIVGMILVITICVGVFKKISHKG